MNILKVTSHERNFHLDEAQQWLKTPKRK